MLFLVSLVVTTTRSTPEQAGIRQPDLARKERTVVQSLGRIQIDSILIVVHRSVGQIRV